MQVYIMTDLEGIAGICLFEQTRPGEVTAEEWALSRALLTEEVNAAVQGCLDGGATRVVVNDGHGPGMTILPHAFHPGAELLHGRERPYPFVGCDETFDAVMLVGAHAMHGTPTGILHHTQSSKAWAGYWVNGRETGEIGQFSLLAGAFGLPVVLVTGDVAACAEARDFLGEQIVTVAVKEGYSRHCERTVAPARARELARAGAREAMGRIGDIEPYRVALPARIEVELQTTAIADQFGGQHVERLGPTRYGMTVDSQHHILRF